MASVKKFNTRDLVLRVDTGYDVNQYPLDDWAYFLDVLCGNRDYQREAILTAIHYFISPKYEKIEDLIQYNYQENDQLKLRYNTIDEYYSKIQLPKKYAASIDLATGTGKSYVMYGIAQMSMGLGIADKVLVLGPPSTTIEKELIKKFNTLSSSPQLRGAIPDSSKCLNPSIISADRTIKDRCICIENINAVYSKNNSSIYDSLSFGKSTRCLVLNDEVHHAYNKISGNTTSSRNMRKWKEFLLGDTYSFKYILGFTGTAYIDNDYFNDVIYRYSLRDGIENHFIKQVAYVVENTDQSDDEKFQKILQNHKRNKTLYPKIKPLTIIVTKDIRNAKNLQTDLVEFLSKHGEGTEDDLRKNKVMVVTSDNAHKANVQKLPYVDSADESVEWIISVAMLTEGWDVKNVLQIVPMEEKAFNSKLLIAQVLGRGLRIPENYPDAVVTVFNHDKWSTQIKALVVEILEMETKIKNSPILDGERAKFHFTVYNIDYAMDLKETFIDKNTEVYNYKDYFVFASDSENYESKTEYVKVGGQVFPINYNIKKEDEEISKIVDKICDDFKIRKLEGITLNMAEHEYTNETLPDKAVIEKMIRNSMKRVGLTGDRLGKSNARIVYAAFNTLLRKKPKSILLQRKAKALVPVETKIREHETISALGLKSGGTIFYTSDYKTEIVDDGSKFAFEEMYTDETRLYGAFFQPPINPSSFKTPVDMVFTSHDPEKHFVEALVKPENAKHITAWLKSTGKSFYSFQYSYTKGTHTTSPDFNPDFFILIRKDDDEFISVVEIKSDDDVSDENKQKWKYAKKHFDELNNQLKEQHIRQQYFFNFLSPKSYSVYFNYLKDGKLIEEKFWSELDTLLARSDAQI
jgi:type III restriction enzyme